MCCVLCSVLLCSVLFLHCCVVFCSVLFCSVLFCSVLTLFCSVLLQALTEGFGPLIFGLLMGLFERTPVPGAPYLLACILSLWAFLHCYELPPEPEQVAFSLPLSSSPLLLYFPSHPSPHVSSYPTSHVSSHLTSSPLFHLPSSLTSTSIPFSFLLFSFCFYFITRIFIILLLHMIPNFVSTLLFLLRQ